MNSSLYHVKTILLFLKYFEVEFVKNEDVILGKRHCYQKGDIITKSFFIKFNDDNIYTIKKENDFLTETVDLVSAKLDEILEFLFPDLVRVLKIDYLLY
ncbi:hypothetical protein DZ858_01680 [Marixanthomonas ophiurae]|uniref:Uncharacterized protein n=1 Tax=Marixanthomonas ophiurae TaxID=387659 RepID=A0A3E1Q9K5_9FLAO|nr:hypothetical protein DZ858_01680 [Marixanthomonas ophiurae]